MIDQTTGADDSNDDDNSAIGYAEAVTELDEILAELDDDAIDIDVLSARVGRAAELIALCRSRITAAQDQVGAIVESIAPRRTADTDDDSPA